MRRRLLRSRRGLSEIVGALMLVLIVVAAATALAFFVASYQKQVLAQEALANDRSLESLKVIDVTSSTNATGAPNSLLDLNFTVVSLGVNPAVVTEVLLDQEAVRNYTVWQLNLSTGRYSTDTISSGGQLFLGPREEFNLVVDVSAGSGSSFYDGLFGILSTDYIDIQLFTAYANVFTAAFLPPTAIGLVDLDETWNGTAYVPQPILDGSHSFQSGNATIVAWTWSIEPDGVNLSGMLVAPAFTSMGAHAITLTVTNSLGLISTDTFTYTN